MPVPYSLHRFQKIMKLPCRAFLDSHLLTTGQSHPNKGREVQLPKRLPPRFLKAMSLIWIKLI
ncbi:hypothetical protein ROE7235_02403 [Roseibaca ekhonensis]|uniref:Uncharacterized protein n=1 Tax=Roseinatronobacter ekhonensis TaxID=254356 RepID=A0A3B0M9T6_9RHOB|nr:hypothetical protein ROE7235_02403 [Roseibaca ekhonensis]